MSAGDTIEVNISFATPIEIVPGDISRLSLEVMIRDDYQGKVAVPKYPDAATLEFGRISSVQAGPLPAYLSYGSVNLQTRVLDSYYFTADVSTVLSDPTACGSFGDLKFEFVAPSGVADNYVFTSIEVWVAAEAGSAVAGPMLRAVIPEPSTCAIWSLLGLSLIGIGWYRRRRAA